MFMPMFCVKISLVDVCVVATRYFGGTLLGAGGLVRAYSHTSKIALEAAEIITMAQCSVMSAEVDYSFYDRLNILLSDFSAVILNTSFSDKVCVEFSVKENTVDSLNSKLIDVSNGKYALKFLRSEFSKTI